MIYFYWTNRRDVINPKSLQKEQIINHFAKAGSFTTKVNLQLMFLPFTWKKMLSALIFITSHYSDRWGCVWTWGTSTGLTQLTQTHSSLAVTDFLPRMTDRLSLVRSDLVLLNLEYTNICFLAVYWSKFVHGDLFFSLSSLEDYRRTACTSLLKYIVERDKNIQGRGMSHIPKDVQGLITAHNDVYTALQRFWFPFCRIITTVFNVEWILY